MEFLSNYIGCLTLRENGSPQCCTAPRERLKLTCVINGSASNGDWKLGLN